ncbi:MULTISPECIES: pentapeptide repeat-containing protein [Streptomyces]
MTSSHELPSWPHCGLGAGSRDPVGCRGRAVPGAAGGRCLAHLDEAALAAHLAGIAPGAAVDHQGTRFSGDLLQRLLARLTDPGTGHPRLGNADFQECCFTADARFAHAVFRGGARFTGATFMGLADFTRATFQGSCSFHGAIFLADASFPDAVFADGAVFGSAQFAKDAGFSRTGFHGSAGFTQAAFAASAHFGAAWFSGEACFREAAFRGHALFGAAVLGGPAVFAGAVFHAAPALGPLVGAGSVDLTGARFLAPVALEIAARELVLAKTYWASAATLRLRYATVDLCDVVAERQLSIGAHPVPLLPPDEERRKEGDDQRRDESVLGDADPGVRIRSMHGADAAHLALTGTDLSGCLFTGALHLDRLGLEGRPAFARARGRRCGRRVLAEEHHWRAQQGERGWRAAPDGVDVRAPAVIAPLYLALRKSLEDGRNHPDAADFRYGEMEMRRRDATRPLKDRALLTAYWAVSGYALRLRRTLLWLVLAMTATVLATALWGLPGTAPTAVARGGGVPGNFTLTSAPPADPTGAVRDRLTARRLGRSVPVALNAAVFRAPGQDLTVTGTYIDIASRMTEPVLLGLAVLSVRGRIKR